MNGIDFEALDMQYGLPQGTTRAVAQTESNMNPRAVSPAGAQGLMQIMPGTAKDLGLRDPFDAAANADAGARYLSQLMNRYGGNLTKALQAYNFGMGNIDKGRPLPAETQAYAPKVVGNLPDDTLVQMLQGGSADYSDDDLLNMLKGPAQEYSDADLLKMLGGVSGAGQSPEDVPQVLPGRDPDVPMPGEAPAAAFGEPPREGPAYLQVVPPAGRGVVESLMRGAGTPFRALGELTSAAIPDVLERKMTSTGQTYLEHQQEAEKDYQSRRHDPDAPDYPRYAGNIAATLPLAYIPVATPTMGGIAGMAARTGANALRGAIGSVAQPTDELTGGDVAREKAQQLGLGAAVGAAAPAAVGAATYPLRKTKQVLDATRIASANKTVRQAREAAKKAVADSKATVAAAEKEGTAAMKALREKIAQEEQRLANIQRASDRLMEVARTRTGAAQAEAQAAAEQAKAQAEASRRAIADMQRQEKHAMTSLKRSILATKAREQWKVDAAKASLEKAKGKKQAVNQEMRIKMQKALDKKAAESGESPGKDVAKTTVKSTAGKAVKESEEALKETVQELREGLFQQEAEKLLMLRNRNTQRR